MLSPELFFELGVGAFVVVDTRDLCDFEEFILAGAS